MVYFGPMRERVRPPSKRRRSVPQPPPGWLTLPQFQACCSAPSPVKRFGDSVARDTHFPDCPVPRWLAETFGDSPGA